MAGKRPREYPEKVTSPALRSRRAQSQEASRPERLVAASARQESMASEMNVGILQLCETEFKIDCWDQLKTAAFSNREKGSNALLRF
jgi:hypothetical protein